MEQQAEESDEFNDKQMGYFTHGVLASYRMEPDKYEVTTDNFEGRVQLTTAYAAELCANPALAERINVRFGYRTLYDGQLAIAAYMPDLIGYSGQPKKSQVHQRRWSGFLIQSPEWTDEPDERFNLWVRRYGHGSFDVEDGPIRQLHQLVLSINALTNETLGYPLFKFDKNPELLFPAAQNTHQYQDAHGKLYGYVIDGLDNECIVQLALRTGVTLTTAESYSIKRLKETLPNMPVPTQLWSSLYNISKHRGVASHSVRAQATHFAAFEQFNQDLTSVITGLSDLLAHLEGELGMDSETASEGQAAQSTFPKIDTNPDRARLPHFLQSEIRQAEGKTIATIDYGPENRIAGVQESEVIVLHFTDGSSLGITTGSNVEDMISDHDDLQPEDLRGEFIFHWVDTAS